MVFLGSVYATKANLVATDGDGVAVYDEGSACEVGTGNTAHPEKEDKGEEFHLSRGSQRR